MARLSGPPFNRAWFRLILLAVLLALVFRGMDGGGLLGALRHFDVLYGLAMVLVLVAALALFALRWQLIARALGIEVPYGDYVRVLWLSQCAGEIGPPLLVGELARYEGLRGQAEPWRRLASQAVDRWSGQVTLWLLVLVLSPVYFGLFRDLSLPRLLAFGALLLAALGVAVVAVRRFLPVVWSHSALILGVLNPFRAPLHYGLSLLLHGLLSLNVVLAALGLGAGADFRTLLLLGPLVLLGVGSLPSLVSDWGKREAAALLVLAPAGLSAEQCVAVSLLYGAAQLVAAMPGGVWWGFRGRG